jgi:hypothetical protein
VGAHHAARADRGGPVKRALATTALAVLGVAGYAGQAWLACQHTAATTTPRACSSPALPSGDAIKVDTHGNAWTLSTRVSGPTVELVCTDGTWVRAGGAK